MTVAGAAVVQPLSGPLVAPDVSANVEVKTLEAEVARLKAEMAAATLGVGQPPAEQQPDQKEEEQLKQEQQQQRQAVAAHASLAASSPYAAAGYSPVAYHMLQAQSLAASAPAVFYPPPPPPAAAGLPTHPPRMPHNVWPPPPPPPPPPPSHPQVYTAASATAGSGPPQSFEDAVAAAAAHEADLQARLLSAERAAASLAHERDTLIELGRMKAEGSASGVDGTAGDMSLLREAERSMEATTVRPRLPPRPQASEHAHRSVPPPSRRDQTADATVSDGVGGILGGTPASFAGEQPHRHDSLADFLAEEEFAASVAEAAAATVAASANADGGDPLAPSTAIAKAVRAHSSEATAARPSEAPAAATPSTTSHEVAVHMQRGVRPGSASVDAGTAADDVDGLEVHGGPVPIADAAIAPESAARSAYTRHGTQSQRAERERIAREAASSPRSPAGKSIQAVNYNDLRARSGE